MIPQTTAAPPPVLTLRGVLDKINAGRRYQFAYHQLRYAVSEYGIEPVARAGIIRLYSENQIPTILAALTRISERRRSHA